MGRRTSHTQLSVDEIVSLLKKTTLPTIIVEGSDDMIVYRRLESLYAHLGISVFPVGGRGNVLSLFLRRNEVPHSVKTFYIADRDTWVHTGIPSEYCDPRIHFTDGYSIENDVYADGQHEKLLHGSECINYAKDIADFVEWYALALTRHLNDPSIPIAVHPKRVLDSSQRAQLLALAPNEIYPTQLRDQILENYQRFLRGKSLFDILLMHTNRRGREPHHSIPALLEIVASNPGALVSQIFDRVQQFFESGEALETPVP